MQKVLTYAYIILAIAAFCYWISCLLGYWEMLKHRKQGRSLFSVAAFGFLNAENFTEQGNIERRDIMRSIAKFFGCVFGLVIVVFIGIQTQA